MLVKYSKNINKFSVDQTCQMLCILYNNNNANILPELKEWYQRAKDYYNPVSIKTYKEYMEKIRLDYFGKGIIKDSILTKLHPKLMGNKLDQDNLIMSLIRSWEWPYYSDQEMEQKNGHIPELVRNGEINLFNRDKCAYQGKLGENIWEDLISQEENIQNYLSKEGIENLDFSKLKDCIKLLLSWIDNPRNMYQSGFNPSGSFINAINQWRNIRKRSSKTMSIVRNSLCYGIDPEYLMTKVSGSLWNQNQQLKRWMNKQYGLPKITNVVGNFFYSDNCLLPPACTKDLKLVPNFDMNFYTLVCGKGDGYKIRYVGQPATIYQNFLEPLARLLKNNMRAEEGRGGNENISTFDQETIYKLRINKASDAFGIDFTGYSDFMSRNLIFFMCEEVYQWDPEICYFIRQIFSLPIKVGLELKEMLWGSLQGSKFNFHVITDCNQFMWAISCLYSWLSDEANFAGDDRIQMLLEGKYPEDFMETQLAVSIAFNCVTNKSKTESWSYDGIVSFCKITYNKYRQPVSGLSANILQKHKPFINEINAIFKQLKKNGYLAINNDIEHKSDSLINLFYDDLKLYSQKYDIDLSFKISLSKCIPLDWGGLNPESETSQPILYLNMIRGMVNYYIENPKSQDMSKDWLWLTEVNEEGVMFFDTNYGQWLLSNDLETSEVVKMLRMIDKIEEEFKAYQRINMELLKEVKSLFRQVTRDAEYRANTNNVSTKNRNDIKVNEDKLYTTFMKFKDMDKPLSKIAPNNIVNLCLLNCANRSKSDSFDPFWRYMQYQNNKPEWFEEGIITYEARRGQYWLGYIPLKYRNCKKKSIVRLEANSDSYYKGSQYNFVPFEELSEEEKNILNIFTLLVENRENEIKMRQVNHNKLLEQVRMEVKQELKYQLRKELRDNLMKAMS